MNIGKRIRLNRMAAVGEAGGLGATIGRNVWGVEPVSEALRAFKAVILDRVSHAKALEVVGLTGNEYRAKGGPPVNSDEGTRNIVQPELIKFEDDGVIPNSRYPLLLFRNTLPKISGSEVEKLFASNNWSNSWKNGVYPFHHYHSTSHEVLGVYLGAASLQLGGEQGRTVDVRARDMIVIPAGVGHKNLASSPDFAVVGAYPDGRSWDLLTGQPGQRPRADENIAALPVPGTNPVYGGELPMKRYWI
jgi:uncharacterized protein YjlB